MSKGFFRPRWPVVATLIVLIAVAGASYFVLRTIPPRTIIMATGAEGGAYFEIGKRYRELLARDGIDVKLMPTGGAIENLSLMRTGSSGVSVGLVQGGLVTESAAPELESLGTIFYEPLWLFRRRELRGGLDSLVGRKIAIGPEGSGTRALALELLKRNGLDRQVGELLPLG